MLNNISKKTKQSILLFFVILCFVFFFNVPCIFHEITGLHCPGCGAGRALKSLATFNIKQAFKYNALILVLYPFFIIYFILRYILNKNIKLSNTLLYIILFIVIAFGILRNIPFFSFLAPI